VSWWKTTSGLKPTMASVSAAASNTSQTTASAPSIRSMLALSGERVMPATVCPSLISNGTSRVPMTPLAPAMKMRTIVSL
jgi:hypothetical protein